MTDNQHSSTKIYRLGRRRHLVTRLIFGLGTCRVGMIGSQVLVLTLQSTIPLLQVFMYRIHSIVLTSWGAVVPTSKSREYAARALLFEA